MLSPLKVVPAWSCSLRWLLSLQKCAKTLCFHLEAVRRLIWQGRCRYCRRQLVMQPFAELWGGPGHKMASTCSSTMSRFGQRAASNSRSFGTALSCISRQGITACCCDRQAFLKRCLFHLHNADVANRQLLQHACFCIRNESFQDTI